jgi:hypothetical protein
MPRGARFRPISRVSLKFAARLPSRRGFRGWRVGRYTCQRARFSHDHTSTLAVDDSALYWTSDGGSIKRLVK